MLWDVANGVSRRCWAGGQNAFIYSEYLMKKFPGLEVTMPSYASDELINKVVSKQ